MAVTALGGAAVSSRLLPSTIKAIASLSISSTSTSSYSLKFLRSSPLISHLFLGQEAGGPKVPMKCGRMVVLGPEPCLEEGRLPDAGPPSPADHRQDVFYRMGLNDKEIVALSGVQTLGRSRPKHSYWGKPETKYTVLVQEPAAVGRLFANEIIPFNGHRWIHSAPCLTMADNVVDPTKPPEQNAVVNASRNGKVKRKKLERKRAVVRWLRSFRWKKKREYQRLTTEEKILYKLNKAKKKEEKLVQALKKIEPTVPSELIHDPEILTPEEHFFFLKMGLKCSNYVPIGRRGIFKGVILNMHLHWKEHQTLRVVVKTFPPEEVKEIASELARLTGGIVLDIHEENTIIMYRGKNYVQPPMEIMSPRITLPRKKALYKSKCRDGLRAVRQYIPKLEQDLKFLRQANSKPESKTLAIDGAHTDIENQESILHLQRENSEMQKEIMDRSKEYSEDDVVKERGFYSDSEDLSDMFESDSEMENEKVERPLHLEEFEKFTVKGNGRAEDFEDHLRQISLDSKDANSFSEDIDMSKFDEVDRLFVRTAALLKKRRGL